MLAKKQNIEQTIKFALFFLKIYATIIKLRASLADLQKKDIYVVLPLIHLQKLFLGNSRKTSNSVRSKYYAPSQISNLRFHCISK